jgi:hypothetical protein
MVHSATSAHFYRAECLFRQNDFDQALQDYEFVSDQDQNRFTEKSLFKCSPHQLCAEERLRQIIFLIISRWVK